MIEEDVSWHALEQQRLELQLVFSTQSIDDGDWHPRLVLCYDSPLGSLHGLIQLNYPRAQTYMFGTAHVVVATSVRDSQELVVLTLTTDVANQSMGGVFDLARRVFDLVRRYILAIHIRVA